MATSLAHPRSLIGIGATAVLFGIALSASGDSFTGAVLTLSSLLVLIYALHRFGRSGPDEPLDPG